MIRLHHTNSQVVSAPVKFFNFPGGEVGVQIMDDSMLPSPSCVIIRAQIQNSEDLFKLALLKDAADRKYRAKVTELRMHYIPYARQDRVCNDGESLSIKVLANFINSMNFDKVVVADSHSDVALALIDNVVHITQTKIIHSAKEHFGFYNVLVAPDAGAEKKIIDVAKALADDEVNREVFVASKRRELSTGRIIATEFPNVDLTNRNALIIDDICDGGMTFIKLAEVLYERGAENVGLYVTHGIFSKGLDVLKAAGITEVFTTNSIYGNVEDSYLKVIGIYNLHETKVKGIR